MTASSGQLAGQLSLQGKPAALPAAVATAGGLAAVAGSVAPQGVHNNLHQTAGFVSPVASSAGQQRNVSSATSDIPAEPQQQQQQQMQSPERGLPVLLSSIFKRSSRSESATSVTEGGGNVPKVSVTSHASRASAEEAVGGERPPVLLSGFLRRSKGASGSVAAAGGVPGTPGASVKGKADVEHSGGGGKVPQRASGPGGAAAPEPLAPDSALASAPHDPLLQPGVLDAVNIKVRLAAKLLCRFSRT